MISLVFSPRFLACGAGIVAVVGIFLAYQANHLTQEQNRLLASQLREAVQQQQNNLYFQGLNRRTYLLTVLYSPDDPLRTRQETLKEFLLLDRDLKEAEVQRNPEAYRMVHVENLESPNSPVDWARLFALRPDLRTDLSGIVLRHMDLEFLDLSDTVLMNADLSCANLDFANLHRADLTAAKFIGASMDGADLRDASATSADFTGARLGGADLQGTWLQDADFSMAFLSGTTFTDYRNERYPPRSADRAFVVDLYDANGSGGASQFARWARANGATTHTTYDGWRQALARDAAAGRMTLPCDS
jgi:uncharacterized protein YjbI with pentapeptide repeats